MLLFLHAVYVLAADNVYELTTAISGVVEKILVKPGEKVKQGQVLLVLDQRVLKADLEAANKAMQSSKLNLEEVRKELERTEALYERTVISDHELELAKVNFAKAEAEHATAVRQVSKAQYQFDYSQIVAPVSGKIKSIPAWENMVVNNQLKNTVLIVME